MNLISKYSLSIFQIKNNLNSKRIILHLIPVDFLYLLALRLYCFLRAPSSVSFAVSERLLSCLVIADAVIYDELCLFFKFFSLLSVDFLDFNIAFFCDKTSLDYSQSDFIDNFFIDLSFTYDSRLPTDEYY